MLSLNSAIVVSTNVDFSNFLNRIHYDCWFFLKMQIVLNTNVVFHKFLESYSIQTLFFQIPQIVLSMKCRFILQFFYFFLIPRKSRGSARMWRRAGSRSFSGRRTRMLRSLRCRKSQRLFCLSFRGRSES